MWVSELENCWRGQAALIVTGGPSSQLCEASDFGHCKTIGVNYAHRIWPCDLLVVVKDYIYSDICTEIEPAKIVAPSYGEIPKDKYTEHYMYKAAKPHPSSVESKKKKNCLYSDKAGGTGVAIHLAHILGANPIYVIGADLCMGKDEQYHAKGYWETDKFKPMGWRQTIDDVKRVFSEQHEHLTQVQKELAGVGRRVYFVYPQHWRSFCES